MSKLRCYDCPGIQQDLDHAMGYQYRAKDRVSPSLSSLSLLPFSYSLISNNHQLRYGSAMLYLASRMHASAWTSAVSPRKGSKPLVPMWNLTSHSEAQPWIPLGVKGNRGRLGSHK